MACAVSELWSPSWPESRVQRISLPSRNPIKSPQRRLSIHGAAGGFGCILFSFIKSPRWPGCHRAVLLAPHEPHDKYDCPHYQHRPERHAVDPDALGDPSKLECQERIVRQQEATGNGEAVDAHVEVEQPAHSLIGKGLTELSGETVTRAEPA